jgi:glycosyltransferase involved in cell wall biosynthesis
MSAFTQCEGNGRGQHSCKDNILLVANYESDVGFAWWLMENYWVQLSRLFERRGAHSFLIYPKINEIPKRIVDSSIRVIAHNFESHSWNGMRALKDIIRDNRIAHVYLTDKKTFDLRYGLLRSWGVKTIVNHDHSPRAPDRRSSLRQIGKQLIHRVQSISCDHYIGVSKFVRDRLVHDANIPAAKVSYILNGIDPIEIDHSEQYYAHDRFGIPRDAIIVVSTGRATLYKRIDALIECARKLIVGEGGNKLYFLHCGDGPDLQVFKRIIDGYGLSNRFILAGRRTDIRHILPSCHIAIQISKGEAFSLSLLEYLSAGLATLASNVGGNPEAVVDGKTGILFHPDDLDKVIHSIRQLATNSRYRRQLGLAARESVKANFSIQRMNRDFTELYENILSSSSVLS